MRRKIKRLEGRSIFASFVKIVAASLLMSVAAYATYYVLTNYFAGKNLLVKMIEAFVPIAAGGLTFLIAAKILGVKELNQAIDAVMRKFKRK